MLSLRMADVSSERSSSYRKNREIRILYAVIKNFYLKKWTAPQIKTELYEVHGYSTPALKTVYLFLLMHLNVAGY